jgi:hypothetical protein
MNRQGRRTMTEGSGSGRGGGLSYSLWNHEKDEERGIGRLPGDRTL